MTTHQIQVLNIKCEGCVTTIQTALNKLKGITSVIVSKEQGLVTVSGVALDRDQIVQELNVLGYPQIGANNFFSKAKTFITCSLEKVS